MPGLVAALALSVALGAAPAAPASAAPQAASWRERNAARAKAGLLPRKPPARKPRALDRRGRRIVRLAAPPPVFLGEPVAIADATEPPRAEPAGWVEDAAPLRLSAAGVEADAEISPRRPPLALAASGVEARAVLRPRSPGLALAASGVEVELTVSLR